MRQRSSYADIFIEKDEIWFFAVKRLMRCRDMMPMFLRRLFHDEIGVCLIISLHD